MFRGECDHPLLNNPLNVDTPQNNNLLNNIRKFINDLRWNFTSENNQTSEEQINSKYSGDYKYNVPEDMIKNNFRTKLSFVTKKYNDIKNNIHKTLKNNKELTSKNFNIENWKNSYLKSSYDYYYSDDYYDSYDDDDDCNGYDDYGGYYKNENSGNEYAKQLITVRYGIYINN